MKICFVSQNIYPVLQQSRGVNFIGGAEVEQYSLGKELCRRRHEVTFITQDYGQGSETRVEDFRVVATSKPGSGIPGLKFFYPRLSKLWMALNRVDADIYYLQCASYILAVLVVWARLNRKKVLYYGGNDPDFDPDKIKMPTLRDKWMFFWGLRRCDQVVVQNTTQLQLLQQNFDRDGALVGNGMPRFKGGQSTGEFVLWVANIKPHKRPELFIDLAKYFPDERFVMIGGIVAKEKAFYDKMESAAREVENLEFLGFQPFDVVEEYFGRAKVFVNTSIHEGFANTFLQAWRRGIPVISLTIPEKDLVMRGLVIKADDFEDLRVALEGILSGRVAMPSDRIRQIFDDTYSIEKKVDKYEQVFETMGEAL